MKATIRYRNDEIEFIFYRKGHRKSRFRKKAMRCAKYYKKKYPDSSGLHIWESKKAMRKHIT